MSLMLKANSVAVVAGLETMSFTVSVAGPYFISAIATDCPPSGLSLVINQNGSPIATAITPATFTQTLSTSAHFQGSISDVITVVISSSAFEDQLLNTVKTTIRLDGGSST